LAVGTSFVTSMGDGAALLLPAVPAWGGTSMAILRRGEGYFDNLTSVHKNSLDYVGDTHVYAIKGPNGTYKIGESAQGVRASDGASIRAEQQARQLTRETGDIYETQILEVFPGKASAREYETALIERFRRMFGDLALPGNKTNR